MLNAPRHRAVPRPLLAGAAAVAACGLAISGPVVAFPAAAAASVAVAQQPGGSSPVSVAITSVSPQYAEPGKTVTVSGTLTNTSSAPMSGLSVQLNSSSVPFGSRSLMQEYADGNFSDESPVFGAVTNVPGTLAAHSIVTWSIPLNPDEVPISGTFGVYPLSAQAQDASFTPLSVSNTFLPFWPDNKATDPSVQEIAWIWPLIDQPRQGACPGLLDNGLASSLAPGGRLDGLLEAGDTYASSAHLTWAIDPALLADAQAMTRQYQVSGPACQGPAHPASQAAAEWLAQLQAATSQQPVIVTPYDDADIAALVSSNMNADLTWAFKEGRDVAGRVLGQASIMNGTAWLADGIANYPDLENLAASDGINTVVLDGTTTMPPSPPQNYTPSAQTTTLDGVGAPLNVLLYDDTITQILSGSANSSAASAATSFSVAQEYLAQTAMIAAEQPNLARSIVVAPPRRWDPPAGLANDLLSETVAAPWLRTVSLSQLAASASHPTGQVPRQAPAASSDAQLGQPLLSQARGLDQQAKLLESLQASPDATYVSRLNNAVAAVESSAWRGGGAAGAAGSALAQQAQAYLQGQARKVTISVAPRVTLGGLTGSVPVSVSNGLDFPVRVGLQTMQRGRLNVHAPRRSVTVPAGQQEIIKLQVSASAVGSNTLQIGLVTAGGSTLPARASIIVQATHYGDLALIIIAAALGVLLLTSGARALRRRPGAPPSGAPDGGSQPSDTAAGPGPADPGQSGPPDQAEGPGSVVPDGRGTGQVTDPTRDHDRAEATDGYAWAPGQAERR
jgi:hypothetical protein